MYVFSICLLLFVTLSPVKLENYESALENGVARIACDKLKIFPNDTVKWTKNGINVVESNPKRIRIDDNGTLVINPVNKNDLGFYTCVVETERYKSGKVIIQRSMFFNVQCKLTHYFVSLISFFNSTKMHIGIQNVLKEGVTNLRL